MAIKTGRTSEAGRPVIDTGKCTNCGLCAAICPTQTLVADNGAIRVDPDTGFGCIGCGQCMAICPPGAVAVTGRELSPADVLKLPPVAERATADQLKALMLARRSIRHFTDREIEPDVVERMLAMASTAPIGIPPSDVGVLVFNGRARVQELAADTAELMAGTLKFFQPWRLSLMRPLIGPVDFPLLTGFVLPLCREVLANRAAGRDVLLYDAPLALLFYSGPGSDVLDSHIVATYTMLAGEALGLGSCMIGSVTPFIERDKKLKAKYGIDPKAKLSTLLIFGYPKYKFSHALSRTFAEVRQWQG
ncbi:nitroreductase family protein [bacterium]|nr:nitroreductase family protein [bacterium]